jgi:hypothetical protein
MQCNGNININPTRSTVSEQLLATRPATYTGPGTPLENAQFEFDALYAGNYRF